MKKQQARVDKYKQITDMVIASLEKGVVPWHKPFGGESMAPRNFVSKRRYSGGNVFLLGMAGYDAPYWLTFNQAKGLGGSIRKGESATHVTFFNFREVEGDDGEKNTIPILGTKAVFNIEQTEGIEWEMPAPRNSEASPIEDAERLVAGYEDAPQIVHKNDGRAYYSPARDVVSLPEMSDFDSVEHYYGTLFHELVHSTGHESRLNRDIKNGFGGEQYSREELVAEMGAMFLCSEVGLETTYDNSAAYIGSWIKALQNDHKMIIWAAGRAQKAADRIIGKEDAAENDEKKVA